MSKLKAILPRIGNRSNADDSQIAQLLMQRTKAQRLNVMEQMAGRLDDVSRWTKPEDPFLIPLENEKTAWKLRMKKDKEKGDSKWIERFSGRIDNMIISN